MTTAEDVYAELAGRRRKRPSNTRDLFELPAARLAELRCSRGHLVGIVYGTHAGPLFVPVASRWTNREAREAAPKWLAHPGPEYLVLLDHTDYDGCDVTCTQCRERWGVTMKNLRDAADESKAGRRLPRVFILER